MKKPTHTTKLSLSAETIRTLENQRLAQVAGGLPPPNWTTTTTKCTHDIFCPSRMCG